MKKIYITKYLFLIFVIALISTQAFANLQEAIKLYDKNAASDKIMFELIDSKYYFSAIPFSLKYLFELKETTVTDKVEEAYDQILLKTGFDSFYNIEPEFLAKFKNSPTLQFIAGKKFFDQEKYQAAIDVLSDYPKLGRYASEVEFIKGASYYKLQKDKLALKSYDECIVAAKNDEQASAHIQQERYFEVIKENCLIHKARLFFREGNLEKARDTYDELPKRSYLWPFILLEKAWISYKLKDYNKALGQLVTYKSPLLESYFIPEAEVLTALSYFKLCLWDDSNVVINQFYNVYKERSDELKKLIQTKEQSNSYFYDLVSNKLEDNKALHPYAKKLLIQIKKKIKYSLDTVALAKLNGEQEYIRKLPDSKLKDYLIKSTNHAKEVKIIRLNYFVKKEIYDFLNQIHKLSSEMFNIKLEIMARQKDLIYENKTLNMDRKRGSLENVQRRPDQFFWHFKGAFWADELGEYSFGLKSLCVD